MKNFIPRWLPLVPRFPQGSSLEICHSQRRAIVALVQPRVISHIPLVCLLATRQVYLCPTKYGARKLGSISGGFWTETGVPISSNQKSLPRIACNEYVFNECSLV